MNRVAGQEENVHATALSIDGRGILIRGAAQSGKSSLCVSLLRRAQASGRDALLVADDRVDLRREEASITMSAPAVLRGLIEISGIGIVREPVAEVSRLDLVVDLVSGAPLPRLPDTAEMTVELFGVAVRRIRLPFRDAAFSADIVLTILFADNYL